MDLILMLQMLPQRWPLHSIATYCISFVVCERDRESVTSSLWFGNTDKESLQFLSEYKTSMHRDKDSLFTFKAELKGPPIMMESSVQSRSLQEQKSVTFSLLVPLTFVE